MPSCLSLHIHPSQVYLHPHLVHLHPPNPFFNSKYTSNSTSFADFSSTKRLSHAFSQQIQSFFFIYTITLLVQSTKSILIHFVQLFTFFQFNLTYFSIFESFRIFLDLATSSQCNSFYVQKFRQFSIFFSISNLINSISAFYLRFHDTRTKMLCHHVSLFTPSKSFFNLQIHLKFSQFCRFLIN